MAWMEVEIDLKAIALQFANELHSHVLLEFITDIDEHVAEMDFTVTLRDRLNEIIDKEEGHVG